MDSKSSESKSETSQPFQLNVSEGLHCANCYLFLPRTVFMCAIINGQPMCDGCMQKNKNDVREINEGLLTNSTSLFFKAMTVEKKQDEADESSEKAEETGFRCTVKVSSRRRRLSPDSMCECCPAAKR